MPLKCKVGDSQGIGKTEGTIGLVLVFMDKTAFRNDVYKNLTENILPYWSHKMLDPKGGFFGRRDGKEILYPDSPKGAILNARILWAFSAAYRVLKEPEYLEMAQRAKQYILQHFIDKDFGGVFWSLNADGTPLDTKKQFYAIGFTIYGLSEFSRATGDEESKKLALKLFELIEMHSRDKKFGGYIEAVTRDWKPISDMRLSDKDDNAAKTMNTHLHILEPYTNLLRIAPENENLRNAVKDLLDLFFVRIKDSKNQHLGLFFDNDWKRRDNDISFGHDIEASWLLLEAAQVLNDKAILENTLFHSKRIALAALEGRCFDGSMIYERYGNGHYDNDKHWWVQAENVIGQLYLWKFHGMEEMLEKSMESWRYINNNIVDNENGEWFWSRKNKEINHTDDKAGFWKCPYHNARMCLEVIELTEM